MFRVENALYQQILQIDHTVISEGQTTCITGKSGSGKSTFIKLLNGMISPDRGAVYYKGKDLSKLDLIEHRRNVIMLQQTPSIYEGTIEANLQIGRKFSNLPAASEQDMKQVLDFVHLEKTLQTSASELSGGEKQRLALARVLLLKPEVVLMDEPTSALDEGMANEMMIKILKFMKEQEITPIMITHSKSITRNFAESVIEIEHGRASLVKEG